MARPRSEHRVPQEDRTLLVFNPRAGRRAYGHKRLEQAPQSLADRGLAVDAAETGMEEATARVREALAAGCRRVFVFAPIARRHPANDPRIERRCVREVFVRAARPLEAVAVRRRLPDGSYRLQALPGALCLITPRSPTFSVGRP